MVCKISIPVDFLFKKYNAIGNVPYLVEYGYFPTVINVYFSANCLHFSRCANPFTRWAVIGQDTGITTMIVYCMLLKNPA